MFACIPTNGGAGLDDTLCDHFGSAPYFTLYDTRDDRLTVIENINAHHGHGQCHPLSVLRSFSIDAVVCRGLGKRAVAALNAGGIQVYRARSTSVRDALAELKSGAMAAITAAQACAGHGQGHGGRCGQ
jgi:predicted Fe-Mo cluster-binding NifX family protein